MNLENVLHAAQRRIAYVFDHFDRVIVSVSGGKDSHVLWHMSMQEAACRGRAAASFFLDQEAEYRGTIEVIETMMTHASTVPQWYQVPLRMTNATSHRDTWMHAWAPGISWMRPRSPLAIAAADGAPDRFYDFFPWYESRHDRTAFLVGLRSRESLNRWRAVTANAGYRGIGWSTTAKGNENFRFYPIFDWNTGDVWKYIADNDLRYNRVYDAMLMRGMNERQMRVSFLVHEQSFRALTSLQEIEPDTYDRLLRRLGGVHAAALYADEDIFNARALPSKFQTWRSFRDYLMDSTPLPSMGRLRKRFGRQGDDEATCREHVRQLMIHDFENNVPVRRQSAAKLRDQWWDRL